MNVLRGVLINSSTVRRSNSLRISGERSLNHLAERFFSSNLLQKTSVPPASASEALWQRWSSLTTSNPNRADPPEFGL